MAGTFDAEVAVIGMGVVGLAIARQLSASGYDVVILDREEQAGTQTSSRNSGVIHAGIYYPKGSLKARLCVAGKAMLYDYCASRGINYHRCGKLIAACTDADEAQLAKLHQAARDNGVNDLVALDQAQVTTMEPDLACQRALFSPSTGVLDVPAYLQSLEADAQHNGTAFAYKTEVKSLALDADGVRLTMADAEASQITAKWVVNSAGLGAPALAATLGNAPSPAYAKGNYFTLASGSAPFSRLIYPVPEKAGLGIHYTLDLAGAGRFGPDVEWVDEPDYAVDPARAERFYASIRRFWPDLPDGALVPDYAGIRPKLVDTDGDFQISRSGPVINLLGVESPGLTSSLAIAEYVSRLMASD